MEIKFTSILKFLYLKCKKRLRVFVLPAFILIFTIFSLAGCSGGGEEDYHETSVSISKKGVITHHIIEEFDKDYYNEDELRENINSQIESYCNEKGDDKAVRLKELEVEDGIASAEIVFSGWEDYSSFNDTDFFYGTIEEAMAKEYSTDVTLKSSTDDETISKYEFESLKSNMIIVTSEPVLIKAPNKIIYTTANIDIVDKSSARMASDSVGLGYIVLK